MTNIRPVEDRILVRVAPPEETMVGGIIVPETAQPMATHAVVLACGPGRYVDATGERAPLPCEDGDYVLLQRGAGCDIGQHNLRILAPRDILAVVEAATVFPGEQQA